MLNTALSNVTVTLCMAVLFVVLAAYLPEVTEKLYFINVYRAHRDKDSSHTHNNGDKTFIL